VIEVTITIGLDPKGEPQTADAGAGGRWKTLCHRARNHLRSRSRKCERFWAEPRGVACLTGAEVVRRIASRKSLSSVAAVLTAMLGLQRNASPFRARSLSLYQLAGEISILRPPIV
jgi:hypothetical protein